jgi:hypothetical protein
LVEHILLVLIRCGERIELRLLQNHVAGTARTRALARSYAQGAQRRVFQ